MIQPWALIGIVIFGFGGFAKNAMAFPELIRHGYVNCNTCHVSPNGGGILNDYGRELSRELLATWKSSDEKSKEHLSMYGALAETPLQQYLKVGGDVRTLYLYQDDQLRTQGRTMVMQAGPEFAITAGKFTADGTVDYEHDTSATNQINGSVISRRHYLMGSLTDELTVRVGKFIPAYGINTADHISLTRTGIRQGPRFESYNAELSYIREKYSFFLTGIIGRPESVGTPSESGGAVQGSYSFSETNKVGVNFLRGYDPARTRWLMGPFGMIGLTKQLMFMTEMDAQLTHGLNGVNRSGFLSTQKLSYEFTDGFWGFLVQEYAKTNFDNPLSQTQVYGMGIQFFPRTHFELNLSWERIRSDAFSTQFYDYAWFVAHFYL